MVGNHDILVYTSCSDREIAAVVSVKFADVADMDLGFVGPYGRYHLVGIRCRDHGIRFGWARLGIGRSHPLVRLDHMPFESFFCGWVLHRSMSKGKA